MLIRQEKHEKYRRSPGAEREEPERGIPSGSTESFDR